MTHTDNDLLDEFLKLQRQVPPLVSIEVGAYDADFSRAMVGIAQEVWAFEASPYVYEKYKGIDGVNYQNFAISNVSGEIPFVMQTDLDSLVGNNSILKRNDSRPKVSVNVQSRTLNELFDTKENIALWVDCEGASEQVLTGASEILPRVNSILIEVESFAYWENQWLQDQVKSYLEGFGLTLHTSKQQYSNQSNQIYLREGVYNADTRG
jgi:FkbM family methyltransferase